MTKKTQTISRAIAFRIEQMILDGSLPPDKKIPSERRLAEKLGVSRSIIREALHELQGRGIIETKHGQGSFVKSVVDDIQDNSALMQLFNTHKRTLYDLYEVRALLEGQAAAMAAERGTDEELYAITKAFNAMEAAKVANNADLDYTFHLKIAEASHNPVLVHILVSLKKLLLQSVETSLGNLSHRESFRLQIEKHHRQIYNAIITRRASWAHKAATAHVEYVSESLRMIEESESKIIRNSEPEG